MVQPLTQQIMFELPESPLNGIPLSLEDKINIGFLEIGIKPKGKRGQLREKKQLILKYWGDRYRREYGFEWIPQTYRFLAHYYPNEEVPLDQTDYELDTVLVYDNITEDMMNRITPYERGVILKNAKNSDYYGWVNAVFRENDPEGLRDILDFGESGCMGQVRGKIAETLVFNDFDDCITKDMHLLVNGDIKYFNKRYQHGTEVDGLFVFHRDDSYSKLVASLENLDHVTVHSRT